MPIRKNSHKLLLLVIMDGTRENRKVRDECEDQIQVLYFNSSF